MAKNTCKLCSRSFASPRALAGHMRAHSVAAAKSQISSASSASTSVVAGGDDDGDAKKPVQGYVLREKPKRRVRLAEPDFSDRESETTGFFPSSPSPTNGHAGSGGDAEPASSVSDAATPEEDVALSLMMLSRDSWPLPPPSLPSYHRDDSDAECGARPAIAVAAQKRTRYECSACKKAFRSYQALGGHRASNVRGGKGGCCAPPLHTPPPSPPQPLPAVRDGAEGGSLEAAAAPVPPLLSRFSSGQALGGHRRSHLCSAPVAAEDSPISNPPVAMKSHGFIDLNLPPTLDDVEVSAVSDARIPSSRRSQALESKQAGCFATVASPFG